MTTLLNKRIRASTLVESIVALLLLSISVGMGMVSYFNIIRSSRSTIKMEAKVKVEKLVEETKAKESWIDEEVSEGKYTITKTVVKYKPYSDMYMLNIKASDTRKVILYNYTELVYSK